ncbi:MAG TPA: class I SAM-dependent methyltransferase, partial [Candidatus Saccharimonadales bacterium]|nr:class I SAM-dependent methyltransferase [Candidatus Saccharimonadales bacterium]
MSADISLYNTHPNKYNDIQNLRPDYKKAIETTVELAIKYMDGKNAVSIADFCGGTGAITKKIADIINIDKAKIIDINQDFLNIAQKADIKVKKLEASCSDILDIKLDKEYDLILSVFAYHHVPDDKKEKYLKQVLDGLKKNGILVLTEIYLPNKEITLEYYH